MVELLFSHHFTHIEIRTHEYHTARGTAITIGTITRKQTKEVNPLKNAPSQERLSKPMCLQGRLPKLWGQTRGMFVMLAKQATLIEVIYGGIKMTCPKCNGKTKVISEDEIKKIKDGKEITPPAENNKAVNDTSLQGETEDGEDDDEDDDVQDVYHNWDE